MFYWGDERRYDARMQAVGDLYAEVGVKLYGYDNE